ncbi:MAG: MarR family transcriptional regulator [Candidatus Hodarchaeota archaeon]
MSDDSSVEDSQDISKLEEEISNFFEDFMYDRGGSPLLGRIYALCVLSSPNKPLLQKDLVEKFKVNPSTISRNLKELENWNLITRRREPGSREWKYQVEPTSFRELLIHIYDQSANSLQEKADDLIRIREHWGTSLSEKSKLTEKGKQVLTALDVLIEWISIVEKELDSFIVNLQERFLELEKRLT